MPSPSSPEELFSRLRQGRVLIVGFARRTGRPAAELFERQEIPYRISDVQPREAIDPLLHGLRIADDQICCGPQTPAQLDGISQVLLSPGVPRTIPLLREAVRRQVPVSVDIDLLYELFPPRGIVAITGTDGKTTTTTLVGELLRALGPVVVAGNIGTSPFAKLDEIGGCRFLVLEVSSFMSEQLVRFRPAMAAMLNIAEDHVDRYATIEQYAAAKFNLVRHCQQGDVLIRNVDDPRLAAFEPRHLTVRTTSRRNRDADACFHDGCFVVGGHSYRHADCKLHGQANIDNVLVAAAIAHEAGVEPTSIARVLRTFAGLPHRLQHLGSYRGVDVYEDSKASNVHAVDAALRNFPANVVLILGGRDKGLDFTVLRSHAPRLRRLVCYGESGQAIRRALDLPGARYRYRFDDAVAVAAAECRAGDVLLLSPGCTSWDQFRDYEQRGDHFQALVGRLFA